MSLSKKLENVRKVYSNMVETPYDKRWYATGERRVGDQLIVDEDYTIEQAFLYRAKNVQKSVRLVDNTIHTRLISMTLFDVDKEEYVQYNYEQLTNMFDSEFEIVEE